MRLLVTRPEPDGERTADALRARGCEVIVAPLLDVAWIDNTDLGAGPWAAVMLTSANAVRGLARHPRRAELLPLSAFAVGRRTADAARDAGFVDVTAGPGNARDLSRLVGERYRGGGPVLYAAGADRSGDLAADLAPYGIEVATVVVYRAVQATAFPPAIRDALRAGRIDGVLHFSRRSAEAYLRCACADGADDAAALAPVQYCLSSGVAAVFEPVKSGKIRIAGRPDEAALLDLVMQP